MRNPLAISLSLVLGIAAGTAIAEPAPAPDAAPAAAKTFGPDLKSALPASDPFGIQAPDAFAYEAPEPEESKVLPRAFKGAPPQISHETLSMLPLRKGGRKANECLSCHDKPKLIGQKLAKGDSPMPKSHYVEVSGELKLEGSRYLCDQCHVPQANVRPLVENTFKPGK